MFLVFIFSLKYAQELSGSCQHFPSSIHPHPQSQSQSITACAQEILFNCIDSYLDRLYHMRYITKEASCLPFLPSSHLPVLTESHGSLISSTSEPSNDTLSWSPPSRTSLLTLFSLEWSNEITDTFQVTFCQTPSFKHTLNIPNIPRDLKVPQRLSPPHHHFPVYHALSCFLHFPSQPRFCG